MDFRTRLLRTLAALQPVLDEPGVLVAGSEVPNLLEHRAASTLVVSEDVDIAIPVERHAEIKRRVLALSGLRASPEEPSVYLPDDPALIEVNFLGLDRRLRDAAASYVLEDSELPLLVFGNLSLLEPDTPVTVDGVTIPLPRKAGLMLEKLLTDRSGRKGDRDLLVVAGLLELALPADSDELVRQVLSRNDEERYAVKSNLTLLSLLPAAPNMPDPTGVRGRVHELIARIERGEGLGA